MDEIVDVVSEQDELLCQMGKKEAHSQGLLHRCVIAQVIDSGDNWTLVQQASDRQDAGQYVSPVGGHVQAGESQEEALKREAFEEMGLENFTYKFVGKAIYNREVIGRKENHYFILFEIFSDQIATLNEESVGYEKFNKEILSTELKQNPEKFGAAFMFVINTFYPELIR